MSKFIFLLLLIPAITLAQTETKQDIFKPLQYFIGKWEGKSTGESGEGKSEREYKSIMNGKYIEVKNKSIYEPQEKNPKGEIHEDWGIISYDKSRKKFVLRQFHVEGFVNQYIQDSISTDSKTIIFISESIENISPGWRAKETSHIINDNEFTETFELAEPNKNFEVYSQNHFKRNIGK